MLCNAAVSLALCFVNSHLVTAMSARPHGPTPEFPLPQVPRGPGAPLRPLQAQPSAFSVRVQLPGSTFTFGSGTGEAEEVVGERTGAGPEPQES